MLKLNVKNFGFVLLMGLPLLVGCDSEMPNEPTSPQALTPTETPSDNAEIENTLREVDSPYEFPGVVAEFLENGIMLLESTVFEDTETEGVSIQTSPKLDDTEFEDWRRILFDDSTKFKIVEIENGTTSNTSSGSRSDLYINDEVNILGRIEEGEFIAETVEIFVFN